MAFISVMSTKKQKQRIRFEQNQIKAGVELLNRFAKRYQTSEDGYAKRNPILPGDKDYEAALFEERFVAV